MSRGEARLEHAQSITIYLRQGVPDIPLPPDRPSGKEPISSNFRPGVISRPGSFFASPPLCRRERNARPSRRSRPTSCRRPEHRSPRDEERNGRASFALQSGGARSGDEPDKAGANYEKREGLIGDGLLLEVQISRTGLVPFLMRKHTNEPPV